MGGGGGGLAGLAELVAQERATGSKPPCLGRQNLRAALATARSQPVGVAADSRGS